MQETLESPPPALLAEENARNSGLYSLPGVIAIVFGYALVHVTIRLLSSGNLGEDDPLDNLLVQTLAPGYGIGHGPLYNWALWLLQQVMGTGIHAFLFLKYGLLIAIAGFLFLITRRITGSALWAFMAVDAMALVYQIFWRIHEGFTHRVAAIALAVMTFWGLLRIIDRGGYRDHVLFGVFVGLGLLTEFTYAAFLFALLVASALQPATRRRVFVSPMFLTLSIPILIISPYVAWVMGEPQRVATLLSELAPFAPTHTFANIRESLVSALGSPILALAPYIFILPAVFPGMLKAIVRSTPIRPLASPTPDIEQFILHVLCIEILMLVIFGSLLFQYANYAPHSLLPMFVIAIVWLTEKVRASRPSPIRIKVFVAIMLAFTALALISRMANLFVLDPVCSKCRWGIPYTELADEMRARGFSHGTIVTEDVALSGNLRRFFPNTRFVLPSEAINPPETTQSHAGQTAIVWLSQTGTEEMPESLRPYLVDAQPEWLQVPWKHLWRPDGYRYTNWKMVIQHPRRRP